ncbi:MAG: hypothetical protein IPP97_09345 [Candidatus Obscuribacter sp.]|nr:hypothetical protein [Candidatus Obscuribacter sp.]MBP6595027.1 hypothetical protein [Candidatus Obscuribacter sp.]MBP7578993.1 hypothetical protein [Candidatus Obscuribacter sp.]
MKSNSNGSKAVRLKQTGRCMRGHAISEFAAALIVLIAFVFAPLFNISIIPIRYLIVQGALTEMSHRIVLCEKRSEAYQMLASDPWLTNILDKCSVTVTNPKLTMTIISQDGSSKTSVNGGDMIPAEWLPDGAQKPSLYSMEISADCSIPPMFSATAGLPGFTSPITMHMHVASPWENFSRDPSTSQYFVNE